jgi:hypothetical protein
VIFGMQIDFFIGEFIFGKFILYLFWIFFFENAEQPVSLVERKRRRKLRKCILGGFWQQIDEIFDQNSMIHS